MALLNMPGLPVLWGRNPEPDDLDLELELDQLQARSLEGLEKALC